MPLHSDSISSSILRDLVASISSPLSRTSRRFLNIVKSDRHRFMPHHPCIERLINQISRISRISRRLFADTSHVVLLMQQRFSRRRALESTSTTFPSSICV
jgi:hypothetical protein